jgi:predicted Zn-dependent protease
MKYFLLGIAGLLVVIGAAFFVLQRHGVQSRGAASERTFKSQEIGLSFTYPKMYNLIERHDTYKGEPVRTLTLIDASTTVPDMSEGPTAISVIEVPVEAGTDLEAWVRSASISNFQLSADKVFTQTMVAGEPALAYRHSGLYEFDATAVKHGNKIFIFSASWMNADDRIRTDFKNMLASVTFTQ